MSLKAQMNLASEPGMSHGMLDVDLKARRLFGLFAQAEVVACGHDMVDLARVEQWYFVQKP